LPVTPCRGLRCHILRTHESHPPVGRPGPWTAHNTSSGRLLTDPPLANRGGRIQQSASEHFNLSNTRLLREISRAGYDDATTQRFGITVVHLHFPIVEHTVIVYSATRQSHIDTGRAISGPRWRLCCSRQSRCPTSEVPLFESTGCV
jgi:hypothetical protein